MSLYIDELAKIIDTERKENNASRADWERALELVYKYVAEPVDPERFVVEWKKIDNSGWDSMHGFPTLYEAKRFVYDYDMVLHEPILQRVIDTETGDVVG